MTEIECSFCKNKFKNQANLKAHQKSAKYCIELRGDETNFKFKCEGCNMLFNKIFFLERHTNTCKSFRELQLVNEKNRMLTDDNLKYNLLLEEKNKMLTDDNMKYKLILEERNKQLENKDKQIKSLQDQLARIALAAATKSTTINNNNNINSNNKISNITALDISEDKLKHMFDTKYNQKYIIEGVKGVAHFVVDNLLKDEKGNLTYVCTDPSRQIFKYKDNFGDIQKDVKCKKLTKTLIDGKLKTNTCIASTNWWTNDEGKTDSDKYNSLQPKALEICMISVSENTLFVNEMSAITTV